MLNNIPAFYNKSFTKHQKCFKKVFDEEGSDILWPWGGWGGFGLFSVLPDSVYLLVSLVPNPREHRGNTVLKIFTLINANGKN